eukprot:jgi/Picre1/27565/NNA_000532.t1
MNDPSELWASGALDDWKALMSSYDTRIGEHKVVSRLFAQSSCDTTRLSEQGAVLSDLWNGSSHEGNSDHPFGDTLRNKIQKLLL